MTRRSFLSLSAWWSAGIAGCDIAMPKSGKPAKGPCPNCKGSGRIQCLGCKGTGHVKPIDLTGKNPKPFQACLSCKGAGSYPCTFCGSSGRS